MKRIICLLVTGILMTSAARSQSLPLEIRHLSGNLYLFVNYKLYEGKPFPSNGLYAVTDSGVVMIDMPWDPVFALPLLDSIRNRHHKEVIMSISTHSHADRTGSIDVLRENGVQTWSSKQTYELCKKKGENIPSYTFTKDTVFRLSTLKFETFYPGEGHTADNIVIWFPQEKLLYGGCFIKSTDATGLGNLEDANPRGWPKSVRRLMAKYPRPAYIIPGHEGWKSLNALKHTLALLSKAGYK